MCQRIVIMIIGGIILGSNSLLFHCLAVLQLLMKAHGGHERVVLIGARDVRHLVYFALIASNQLEKVFYLVLSCAASFHGRAQAALTPAESVNQLNGVGSLLCLRHQVVLLLSLILLGTCAGIC